MGGSSLQQLFFAPMFYLLPALSSSYGPAAAALWSLWALQEHLSALRINLQSSSLRK